MHLWVGGKDQVASKQKKIKKIRIQSQTVIDTDADEDIGANTDTDTCTDKRGEMRTIKDDIHQMNG